MWSMMKDNVDMICSISELAAPFEKSHSIEEFLQQAVSIIARHMNASVCSIYLMDESRQSLVLRATEGLSKDSVGQVRLRIGEGITGMALKELRPIREGRGSENPHFKFVPGIFEEKFEAFLAVPILRGLGRIGVLVVQHVDPDYFTDNDVKALKAIAAQLAATIENAQLLMNMHTPAEPPQAPEGPHVWPSIIRGKGSSPGAAWGTAFVMGDLEISETVRTQAAAATLDDFRRALQESEEQLNRLQVETEERLGDFVSLIFSAQLLMLKDAQFAGAMLNAIKEEGLTPLEAVERQIGRYVDIFAKSPNPKLREKVQDLRDLEHRLLGNLVGAQEESRGYRGQIVIARDVLPSDIVKFSAQKAEGLVLLAGGATSHAAILARSLQLPMIHVQEPELLNLTAEHRVLMDANQGHLFIDPDDEVMNNYRALAASTQAARSGGIQVNEQTRTSDGTRIHLAANINLLSDLAIAKSFKAEGVGLYRSEFPFIIRNDFPSEEEQFRIYRRIVEEMEDRPVVFRTLDIGGDKMLSYYSHVDEANPFLGLRAIRFSLRNKDIFSQQLSALLRAGYGHELRIMFPLISSVDDFLAAVDVVNECKRQLAETRADYNDRPLLGVMIELPSAVEVIDELAAEADFLSLGTNDLVQYMLAVDRTNDQIVDWFVHYHPAVLRAIKRVVDAAQRAGKPVSLCGDMASDPAILPILIGLGLRHFSMHAQAIPRVQKHIEKISRDDAESQAAAVLGMGQVRQIEHYLNMRSSV
ncbi:MAG: phosphoenolpyruvate--protein phosphotransferase [Spartobacteria bacterium]|nr:phosphoenolpyruvate--protein phosphotransferase [Spartobacteria bacterium]